MPIAADSSIAQLVTLVSAVTALLLAVGGWAGIRYNRFKQGQDHDVKVVELADSRVESQRSYTLDQIDKGLPGVGRVIEILTNQVDRQEAQLARQEERIEAQAQKIEAHEARIEDLETENHALRLKVDAFEAQQPGATA